MCGLFAADIQEEYQSNKRKVTTVVLGSDHTQSYMSSAITIPSQWSSLYQFPNM